MRKNVRMKTAMLMVLVMAVLVACGGGNGKVDTLPFPTAVTETGNDILETVTAEMPTTEEIVETEESATEESVVETEESVTEESVMETGETVQAATETISEESVTESEDETAGESNVESAETVEIKKEEPKVIHTHNYAGSIAVNSGCETTGVMAYTCSCGDNYTEPILATGHTWTTTTETVHHPSLGHMERTEKKVITIQCGCGFTTQNNDELDRHCIAEGHEDYPCGSITKTTYEDNWVVTQEEWDEVVTKTVCTVCGLAQ